MSEGCRYEYIDYDISVLLVALRILMTSMKFVPVPVKVYRIVFFVFKKVNIRALPT
jgi:hypothetical protein